MTRRSSKGRLFVMRPFNKIRLLFVLLLLPLSTVTCLWHKGQVNCEYTLYLTIINNSATDYKLKFVDKHTDEETIIGIDQLNIDLIGQDTLQNTIKYQWLGIDHCGFTRSFYNISYKTTVEFYQNDSLRIEKAIFPWDTAKIGTFHFEAENNFEKYDTIRYP
jgi:hypothetical protein